ncbi:MAG: glycosyltransferase family 4 protein, partial [Planctomycetota bacterium]
MSTYRLAFAMVKYFPFGGMQRNLLRIARACAARGHEVHVFAGE